MEAWAALLAQVAEQHPHEIEGLLRYILLAGGEQPVEEVRRSILLHVPSVEAPLASAGEQLIQQGREQGIQQGRQELLAALRGTLRRQLTLRFGAVEASHAAIIEAADRPALEQMLDRTLTAECAEEVLARSHHS